MKSDEEIAPARIRSAVADRYSRIGTAPGLETTIPTGREWALHLGYPSDILDAVPNEVVESFTGIGAPVLSADLVTGEAVLDLGCGAGMDVLLAAQQVGPAGAVYGIDLAPGMVQRAAKAVAASEHENAVILESTAENLPLSDHSVDVALVNGLFNLAPDKPAVAHELARVIRPGGRIVGAEIVITDDRSPGELDEDSWFR